MPDILLYMPYIWLGLAVLFGIAEALTDQLVAIWFAVGCIAAMFVSYTALSVWIQAAAFLIVSAVVLYFVRPIAAKSMQNSRIRTNVDSLIGMVGVVTTEIDNARSQGRVNVNNSDWAAHSEDGQPIPVGEQVLIKAISGVKVIVEPII